MKKRSVVLLFTIIAIAILMSFQWNSFKEANVRALDSFGPTLKGNCSGQEYECLWICPRCQAEHTANRNGQVTKIDGHCQLCQYEVHETY